MSILRIQASAVTLLVSLLAGVSGSAFAQAVHPVCVAEQHDCGKGARIANCCCGDQDTARLDATPVQVLGEVRADLTVTPALPNIVQIVTVLKAFSPVQTSPPRLGLLDLSTLFATFLI